MNRTLEVHENTLMSIYLLCLKQLITKYPCEFMTSAGGVMTSAGGVLNVISIMCQCY